MAANLLRLVPWLLLVYALYVLAAYFLQRRVVFPVHRIRDIPAAAPSIYPGLEVDWLVTEHGTVESWLFPPLDGPSGELTGTESAWPLLIVAHGNGSLMDRWPRHLDVIRRAGFAVAMTEYPGYGRSDGRASGQALVASALAGYDHYSADARIDRERIVGLGRSIGGGVIAQLAAQRELAAMVLFSTFTSLRPFAHRIGVPSWFSRDRFETLEVVRGYHRPILVVHGKQDQTVPFWHGRKLHEAAPNSEFMILDGDHNSIPDEWEQFWRELVGFLREHGVLEGSASVKG